MPDMSANDPSNPISRAASLLDVVSNWATGKTPENPAGYGTFDQLMHDPVWLAITVALDLLLALGYLLIAFYWYTVAKGLQRSPARSAAVAMRNIFLLCGLSSLLLMQVRLYWPAWRLYDLFLVGLVFFVWRYAYSTASLRLLQDEIVRAEKLQQEVEQTRAEVRQKSAFFNAISHDLRTPLNGIVLQSHIIDACARTGDLKTLAAAVQEIRSSAARSEAILSALLAYAQIDAVPPAPVPTPLRPIVEQAMAPYRAVAQRKGLSLDLHCDGQHDLFTDPAKLEQSLAELIENAVKFTETGSITVRAASDAHHATIDVIDTGRGIHENQQPRLFRELSPLQNPARDQHGGIGLGLVIARRIAEQLGGTVELHSTHGHGSQFTLRIPARMPT